MPPEQRLWSSAAGTGKVRHVELRVSSRSQGDHVVLVLAGEIDLYTAPRLQSELSAALADGAPALTVTAVSDAAAPAVASLPRVAAVPAVAPVPDAAAPPAAAATVADLARARAR